MSAQEVFAQGSVCPGGVSAQGCVRQIPPVNRLADACENITMPQLRCGQLISYVPMDDLTGYKSICFIGHYKLCGLK